MNHLSCSAKGGGAAAVTEDACACVLLRFRVQVWNKAKGKATLGLYPCSHRAGNRARIPSPFGK